MDGFDFVKVGSIIISTLSVVVAVLAFLVINLPKRIEETVDRKFLYESEKLKKSITQGEWKVSILTKLSAKSVKVSWIDEKVIRDKHFYVIESLMTLITSEQIQTKHALEALRGKPAISRMYLDLIIEMRPNLDLNTECERIYNELIQNIAKAT